MPALALPRYREALRAHRRLIGVWDIYPQAAVKTVADVAVLQAH